VSDHDVMKRAARPLGLAAATVLGSMAVFTTYAVVMRQVFNRPVLGVVDIMELALVVLIFLSIPGIILRDDLIVVDVVDHLVGRKIRVALRLLGLATMLVFFAVLTFHMLPQAYGRWDSGEVSPTLEIPRYIDWIPIIFGFVASTLATAWLLLRYLRYGVPKNPHLDVDPIE
jgi:TRAP-type C4-dicarboxylate transport system permease small subunit